MRLVDKYTAREFIGPFAAAVAGATVMLLSGILFEMTDLIVDKKMPLETVAKMLFYRIPAVVVISLPIAVLFGTLLSLGRLAKDSELTVLLSTGTPFRRLAIPLIAIAGLISVGNYVLNERVVPASNHRAQTLFREALFTDPSPTVEEGVFFRGPDDRYFYIGQVDRETKQMERILIYQFDVGVTYPEVITAAKGVFDDRVWHLENGTRKRLDEEGFTLEDVRFERLAFPIVQQLDLYLGNQRSTDEMTRAELGRHIELFKRSGIDVKRFEVAYHMKASMPLAGLLWALVGAPLSLRSVRSGRFFGVVVCLGLAFLYFALSSFFRSLGGSGVMPPLAAAWATNALYIAVGALLLARADRR